MYAFPSSCNDNNKRRSSGYLIIQISQLVKRHYHVHYPAVASQQRFFSNIWYLNTAQLNNQAAQIATWQYSKKSARQIPCVCIRFFKWILHRLQRFFTTISHLYILTVLLEWIYTNSRCRWQSFVLAYKLTSRRFRAITTIHGKVRGYLNSVHPNVMS